MAMLPQSMGSAGSGGIIGFSVRVSFLPEEKNIDKRLLSRKCDYDKTIYIFFNALLIDVKAQHKEGLKAEAGKKIFTTSTPEKFLSDPNAQIILSHGFCVRNFRTFSIKSFSSHVGQILLSHLNGGLGSKTCPIPNRK